MEKDDDDVERAVILEGQPATPLPLLRRPLAFTFGLLDQYVLLDPTAEEEARLGGRVTVCVTREGELCGLYKPVRFSLSLSLSLSFLF
jgi:exosome complex RNA-binding protein Rrp42 (RNase PH superfamily)